MNIMMIIAPIAYIGANTYLFLRTWQVLSSFPMWGKIAVAVLFWLVAVSLFVAMALRDSQLPAWLLKSMFNIGSVWILFMFYMVLALALFDVIKHFVPTMGYTLWYALPVVSAVLFYGYIHYKNPTVEHFDITLPKHFDSEQLTIVAVSDIHLGYGTGVDALAKYVDKINAWNPDVVLISGDLIDNSLKPLENYPFQKELSRIKAPMGIYMVPGNHEYFSGIDACENYLNQIPIRLLRDSVITLPCGVQILGRDDLTNRHRLSLKELMDQTDPNQPVIVLDHQPYHLAKADSLGVDIQLSGHTHHGQVWPLNLLTDHIFEQSHGYRKWNHAHIWVSNGLSLWGPPFRIGTDSNMAVFTIRPKR